MGRPSENGNRQFTPDRPLESAALRARSASLLNPLIENAHGSSRIILNFLEPGENG